ncbi:DUF2163 domain-containing protein [Tabrizicola sp.]|uniref:DUF2163 domain-containing protein n=1 Tax=Tabrizicola sp. TaxID=2005166 RepID=UPI002733D7B6|nr:DUF2163 domain-containing protein [Tabrizicola sp.]MDP3196734.1 DUF2163 domain-containing protein [Tabrizicola sp.]
MTKEALLSHLGTGSTTVCRAWALRRRDGVTLGFTDHDRDIVVDGVTCRADSGMTARTLHQTTGLSVDNTEAFGALSAAAITEADLFAGRFDGAEVRVYLVNWQSPEDHVEQFRGTLGEITRSDGSFKAELRGISDQLNRPQGTAYTSRCSAVLGDNRCRFDLAQPGYFVTRVVETVEDGRIFRFSNLSGFGDRWFEDGRFEVQSGEAAGLVGVVKIDRTEDVGRRIELWQSIGAPVVAGDSIRILVGCDKRPSTCRTKFANFLNYRGFPHIPGEDWLASYPVPDRPNAGARRVGGSDE